MSPQVSLLAEDSAISTSLNREGDTLLVSFGGISQGMLIPKFEFRLKNFLFVN